MENIMISIRDPKFVTKTIHMIDMIQKIMNEKIWQYILNSLEFQNSILDIYFSPGIINFTNQQNLFYLIWLEVSYYE